MLSWHCGPLGFEILVIHHINQYPFYGVKKHPLVQKSLPRHSVTFFFHSCKLLNDFLELLLIICLWVRFIFFVVTLSCRPLRTSHCQARWSHYRLSGWRVCTVRTKLWIGISLRPTFYIKSEKFSLKWVFVLHADDLLWIDENLWHRISKVCVCSHLVFVSTSQWLYLYFSMDLMNAFPDSRVSLI